MSEAPIYCFTSDIEWAREPQIADLLRLFDERNLPLTCFATGKSEVLAERYAKEPDLVGLHPNWVRGAGPVQGGAFVGETPLEALLGDWPKAEGYRNHLYCTHTGMEKDCVRRNLFYDSNLLLFLQAGLKPFRRAVSGSICFPVFWEDDVHRDAGRYCAVGSFASLRPHLDLPGLKVINIHPQLKMPQAFIEQLLDHVCERGYRAAYMRDLYREVRDAGALKCG